MNPHEALQILDNACSQMVLNREGHAQLQRAIMCIHQTIKPLVPENAEKSGTNEEKSVDSA